jgi:nucleotide-binding universal stress UspA family protein
MEVANKADQEGFRCFDMYKKILVALDTSPMGEKVFQTAVNLAQLSQAELLFLHAFSQDSEEMPLNAALVTRQYSMQLVQQYQQQLQEYETKFLNFLESHSKKAEELGLKATYQQINGYPGKVICRVAKESQADLIVIGRRGHSLLDEWILGSVSNYVMHHAKCSVLTVPA